jgi:uncharacterized protein (UPF0335 family)
MAEKYWINWNVVDKVKIGGSMSYWELANKIESIGFRIESIKAIIELVAEGVQDNSHSSPLWGCAEMLDVYIEKLEDLSAEAMELHKESKNVAEKATPVAIKATKGKK